MLGGSIRKQHDNLTLELEHLDMLLKNQRPCKEEDVHVGSKAAGETIDNKVCLLVLDYKLVGAIVSSSISMG